MVYRLLRPGALTFAACAMAAGSAAPAAAQSTVWDATISNTHWYVPVPQLLAYAAPKTGFTNPIPIGDQTLWSLGVSTSGSFTGTSTAKLAIGPLRCSQGEDLKATGVLTPRPFDSASVPIDYTPSVPAFAAA